MLNRDIFIAGLLGRWHHYWTANDDSTSYAVVSLMTSILCMSQLIS